MPADAAPLAGPDLLPRLGAGGTDGSCLFLPAIYEHKAALIGRPPRQVCASAELLAQAVAAEFATYRPAAVVAGIDIYNLEPEALGCPLAAGGGPQEVPGLAANRPEFLHDPSLRRLPDPTRDGRLPVVLGGAAASVAALGRETLVLAPLSGPFTLAVELVGLENLIYALYDHPAQVHELLEFCLEVATNYGRALLGTGAQLAIFDSRASCSLISPRQFRELAAPLHERLLAALRQAGARFLALIIGGNTAPVAETLFAVRPDLLVADFNVDPEPYLALAARQPTIVRVNIDPRVLSDEARTVAAVRAAAARMRGRPRCVIGSGIVPYDTPPAHLLAAWQALRAA